MTDISFGRARGGLTLSRIWTSDLAGTCQSCPFGRGWTHSFAYQLSGFGWQINPPPLSSLVLAGRVFLPGDVHGRLFAPSLPIFNGDNIPYVWKDIFTPSQLGDEVKRLTNGTYVYKYNNGNEIRFSGGDLTLQKPIAMVDRNGNTTTLTYTGDNLTQITDAVGRSINLEYSGTHISRVTDPLGRAWQYAYDGGNRLTTVTDPAGNTVSYGYDVLSRIISVTDKRGNVAKQITYGSDGRVSEERFADGGIQRIAYSLAGNVVTGATVTDTLGRPQSKEFNASGYIIGMTDELGQTSQIKRDNVTNQALSTTGPCGCPEDQRTYDERGNVISVTDRLGHTVRTEYETLFNNVTKETDKLGNNTFYSYDARGNRVSVTNALGQVTNYTYDAFGQLTLITDPLGHTTSFEYDTRGNLTKSTDALGNQTLMEYDLIGRRTAMIDPLGRRTSLVYDALDRVTSITDPSGAVTTIAYDPNGNQISLTNAQGKTWTNLYDVKNRLVSKTDPLGRVNRYEYNTEGELLAMTSPSGRVTRYAYDIRGQRTLITDPLNGVIRFSYDNRGNLTALTDQRNQTTTFTYDELFRPISKRDPLGKTTLTTYDANNNVKESIDRLNRRTGLSYDGLNRAIQIDYSDAVVTYTYDSANRLVQLNDTQDGGIQWNYDNADRVLSETTTIGLVSYTYNPASQRTTMTAANAAVVNYAYDTAGRLSTINQGSETFTYGYDTLSRMQSLQRPNGVTTSYQYDAVDRLIRLTHTGPAANPIEDFQYGFNEDDEIEVVTSLASATLLPVAKTANVADAANRIPQFGQASYGFDLEGQTTTKNDPQGVTTYNWDARGRLVSVALPGGQNVSYSYDAFGRRKSRTSAGVVDSFLYDGWDVVRDSSSGGSVVDYLNEFGIDQKLRLTSGGTNLFYLRDHLGSTTGMTNAAGVPVERAQYEVFGTNAGTVMNRFGFTGRELEPTTGLVYFRARWLDPFQGRFFSEDPIGFEGGFNAYLYARNNPINFNDPLGLSPCDSWYKRKIEELENKRQDEEEKKTLMKLFRIKVRGRYIVPDEPEKYKKIEYLYPCDSIFDRCIPNIPVGVVRG